ncbi:hypothetical protein YDYSG_42760 [Paenibacillus tyrfis]|nr:hypothetical protein YDYSG_42760 [Paenibacillus tyrfis]
MSFFSGLPFPQTFVAPRFERMIFHMAKKADSFPIKADSVIRKAELPAHETPIINGRTATQLFHGQEGID